MRTAHGSQPTARSAVLKSNHRACAPSQSRRRYRLGSLPPRLAAPTPSGTSRRAYSPADDAANRHSRPSGERSHSTVAVLVTGIRAVDHAVEDICSVNGQPISEGTAYHALRLLGGGLPRVKVHPDNREARLDCQIGAWMSMVGSQTGVSKGASHGIGHVLGGTAGVPRHLLYHASARAAPGSARRLAGPVSPLRTWFPR